jgi:hypothetical protein
MVHMAPTGARRRTLERRGTFKHWRTGPLCRSCSHLNYGALHYAAGHQLRRAAGALRNFVRAFKTKAGNFEFAIVSGEVAIGTAAGHAVSKADLAGMQTTAEPLDVRTLKFIK